MFSAVGSCFLGTLLIFQRQLRVELEDLQISVQGRVEMVTEGNDIGKYEIKDIEISLNVKVKGDEDDKVIVEDCIRLAEQHCPIKRTLQKAIPITIKSMIETSLG